MPKCQIKMPNHILSQPLQDTQPHVPSQKATEEESTLSLHTILTINDEIHLRHKKYMLIL